jgi:flagellar basal-body rod protein FlgF
MAYYLVKQNRIPFKGEDSLLSGIKYSKNGLEANAKALDIVANNLANINTAGFKRNIVFMESLKNAAEVPEMTALPNTAFDFSQGDLEETGNKLDLAIDGRGLFTIQTENGIRYTRQGHFSRNAEGLLSTGDGDLVLGKSGPIPIEGNFSIAEDGTVLSNGEAVSTLSLADIDDVSQLKLEGNGLFSIKNQAAITEREGGYRVLSGFLEKSNVEPISEMVTMIELYRQFEANQRAIRAQDDTLEKAVNEIGKVT